MNLKTLTDTQLTDALNVLTGKERASIVTILHHLNELDSRRLYLEAGFPSLFEYCVSVLKYSPASTARRVAAARCLKNHPELEALLLEGSVTLCTVSAAAESIRARKISVSEIAGKTKLEVQTLVAATQPVAKKPRESITPLVVKNAELPMFTKSDEEERVMVRFSLSKAQYQEFLLVKEQLSNTLGKELTVEAVIGELMKRFLKPKTREVKPAQAQNDRYVPVAVKRAVVARDKGQCCFESDGKRCPERKFLQIDHIKPLAAGGLTEISNLRLLCPGHNRLMAERHFGKEFMQKQIHRWI